MELAVVRVNCSRDEVSRAQKLEFSRVGLKSAKVFFFLRPHAIEGRFGRGFLVCVHLFLPLNSRQTPREHRRCSQYRPGYFTGILASAFMAGS